MPVCSRCGRDDFGVVAIFNSPQAELFGRYLREVPQDEMRCGICRSEVGIVVERVRDAVRAEIGMPLVCCVCGKVKSGAVRHGYCHDCAMIEKVKLSAMKGTA